TVNGITFNDNGSFTGNPPTASMTFQITGLSAPQTVTFSLGNVNSFNGLTQFGGDSTATATNQNGFAPGFLTNVSFTRDGIVNGVFTNGRVVPIAQMAIASFANPGGLIREGNNLFSVSSESGGALIGPGGSGGRGLVVQGALEASNVDVALELTRL